MNIYKQELIAYLTQKRKIMKFKVELRILENANELINSRACGIACLKESDQTMGNAVQLWIFLPQRSQS